MRLNRWIRTHWDRVIGWSVIALGVVVLFLGWNGLSNTPYPAEQIPFMVSGGIGGGLLVVCGAALLISADLRDEWHKLDRIDQALRESDTTAPPTAEHDDTTEMLTPGSVPEDNGSADDAEERVGRSKAGAS